MKPLTTVASVEAARPVSGKQVEYPDSKVHGLALRVTDAGGKSWTLRYRNSDGKQKRLSLGRYPVVGLSVARTAALDALAKVASGLDPARLKRDSKAAAKAYHPTTVTDLIERYLGDAAKGRHRPNARPKRQGTMDLDRYYFDRSIKPAIGSTAIGELTRADVQQFLDKVGDGAPSTARHCRAVLRQVYNYAIRNELATANPAQLASLPAAQQRERVLTDDELKAIWNAAEQLVAGGASTGLPIQLAMLTLQRGGEVTGIHSQEIDRETRTWTIPGARTKNHRTHVVPLSDQAIEVLQTAFGTEVWNGYAFPARKGAVGESIRRDSISKSLRRLTEKLEIEDATPHDFRRTGATNITAERIGMPRFIVSRVLNQISDTGGAAAVTARYDRNEYLSEKRKALDQWSALLIKVVARSNEN
jgi:integrase